MALEEERSLGVGKRVLLVLRFSSRNREEVCPLRPSKA